MNVIVSNKYQTLLSGLSIDVIKNINGVFTVDDLAAQFKNFFYNKMILDITALENYQDINTMQKLSVTIDMSKVILLLDDSAKVNSPVYLSQLVSMGIYNFTKDFDTITFLMDNPNTYKDVASYHQLSMSAEEMAQSEKEVSNQNLIGQRVIGVKNLTDHAGSTTFTYLLKKHLESLYKVKAVEVDKHDFTYFNDQTLDYRNKEDLKSYIATNSETEVILIDLADSDAEELCSDVIYLIEPGLIQLNRLIRQDNRVFERLKGKKLVLNRSVLNTKDVEDFERESGSRVFFNMPNIDDKLDNVKAIKDFLLALGFTRFTSSQKSKGFSLFG